jgi:hypothetical protein
MSQIQTHKFTQDVPLNHIADPRSTSIIEASFRPYRIGLKNQTFRSVLVFDLFNCITLGRDQATSNTVPHINLQPYNALELGVSRQHAILKREADHVFLIDNNSANGVLLNQQALRRETPYLVNNGDFIKLGLLNLQLIFLINPFLAQ